MAATLTDLLEATFALEHVEVEGVVRTDGIEQRSISYIDLPGNRARSFDGLIHKDEESGATYRTDAESIIADGTAYIHTGGNDDEWMTVQFPRLALGPLAFLTPLFGVRTVEVPPSGASTTVRVSRKLASQQVPQHLADWLDDIFSGSTDIEDAPVPDEFDVTVAVDPTGSFISHCAYHFVGSADPYDVEVTVAVTQPRSFDVPQVQVSSSEIS